MATSRVELDTITYNAAVSACEKGGQWAWALELLADMEVCRVGLDTITYTAAISACERGPSWQHGFALFLNLSAKFPDPAGVTLGSVINACRVTDAWVLACSLLHKELNRWLTLHGSNVTVPCEISRNSFWNEGLSMLLHHQGVLAVFKGADISTESIIERVQDNVALSNGPEVTCVSRLDLPTS